jgi:hypothetical protein
MAEAEKHIQRLAKVLPPQQRHFRTFIYSNESSQYYIVIQADTADLLFMANIKDTMDIMNDAAPAKSLLFLYPTTICLEEGSYDINTNCFSPFKTLPTKTLEFLVRCLDAEQLRLLDDLPQYSVAIVAANSHYGDELTQFEANKHIQRLAKNLPQEQRNFRTFRSHGTFLTYTIVIQANTLHDLKLNQLKAGMDMINEYFDHKICLLPS